MACRYRLTPAADQELVMWEHCAHARFVWNLAFELSRWGTLETYGEAERRKREDGTVYVHQKHRPVRPLPKLAAQCAMLSEARAEFDWLRAGSSSVAGAVSACGPGGRPGPRRAAPLRAANCATVRAVR